ncbi:MULTISPECIES: hypothetical protein [unclassified Variovorax]|uniref:hypothetical protein n=1 Tax=unclassified Variovorax TaxID=663243 RepID=UPI0011AFB20D|nr:MULTISPECIES: hypothetical protein [unclassified Variovorax]
MALLKQLTFQLTIHAPRWTPELRELQSRAESFIGKVEATGAGGLLADASLMELLAKAARYDRLRALAEATSTEHAGFRVGDRLYPTFDAAFDQEMATAEADHSVLR